MGRQDGILELLDGTRRTSLQVSRILPCSLAGLSFWEKNERQKVALMQGRDLSEEDGNIPTRELCLGSKGTWPSVDSGPKEVERISLGSNEI